MEENDPPKARTQSRVVTVIAVIFCVTVLAGLLLPVVGMSTDGHRRQSQCGKNQSQIIGAMVAYFTNEGFENWAPPEQPITMSPTAATSARFRTAKYLEALAASLSIQNSLFKCPQSRSLAPASKPNPSNPASTWGFETGRVIGYALDWAAPADASSSRPMIADRDSNAHSGAVMVAYGDAHVTKLKQVPRPVSVMGTLITAGVDGAPISTSALNPPDDDIYTPFGDSGDSLIPGKGDPLRAWVK
jgi:type II secretory pathway pseudopilin PulG